VGSSILPQATKIFFEIFMNKIFVPFFLSLLFMFSLLISSCGEQKIHSETTMPVIAEVSTPPKQEKSIEITEIKNIPDIKKCVCVQLWMPVCGENGKTYSNACFAKCAGVKFKQGPCAITD
jgi:hypothetical protein